MVNGDSETWLHQFSVIAQLGQPLGVGAGRFGRRLDGTVEDAIHPGRTGCGDWYYQNRICDPIQKPSVVSMASVFLFSRSNPKVGIW
jgi:hypothetical protein